MIACKSICRPFAPAVARMRHQTTRTRLPKGRSGVPVWPQSHRFVKQDLRNISRRISKGSLT
ncbi:MAG: hypothetical protein CTY20_08450 [Hyphomicrobium sp.]|nr:MAG: hypothetical protein CTY20_08450 [Hyphomicrobium sp.]